MPGRISTNAPKSGDALHLAEVGLVQLGTRRQLFDDGDGLLRRVFVRRCHVDPAVVLDVDLDAGAVDDAADGLSARSDHVANLVDRNLNRHDARGVRGDGFARRRDRDAHLLQNVKSAGPRLVECFAHDLRRNPGDLDVHLQRGDALAGTGDLEIHVAVVILGARDVGENGVPAVRLVEDQSHRDSGHGTLHGHAGVHQREGAAADAGHGRRAVGFENVRDDA